MAPSRSIGEQFRSVSGLRVLLALALVGIVAFAGCYGQDGIASWRASSLYETIESLIKEGKGGSLGYSTVQTVVARPASQTKDLGDGRFQEDYVFDGFSKLYIVRAQYWKFPGEETATLSSVHLLSEQKL